MVSKKQFIIWFRKNIIRSRAYWGMALEEIKTTIELSFSIFCKTDIGLGCEVKN
jgi:hypothetical protein